jgi:hypothetical protein
MEIIAFFLPFLALSSANLLILKQFWTFIKSTVVWCKTLIKNVLIKRGNEKINYIGFTFLSSNKKERRQIKF